MAKSPDIHPYSDRRAFERLMLLIAAIAQNPGIAPQKRRNAGLDPMESIQQKMMEIATEQGIEYKEYSLNTLRKDLVTLRIYGILPSETSLRAGYFLGKKQEVVFPVRSPPIPRKSTLSVKEIEGLRKEGMTLQAIADKAGLSRERIRQILLET